MTQPILAVAAGSCLALAYHALLWVGILSLCRHRVFLTSTLTALRGAAVVVALWTAAHYGAIELLGVLAGFLIGRTVAIGLVEDP